MAAGYPPRQDGLKPWRSRRSNGLPCGVHVHLQQPNSERAIPRVAGEVLEGVLETRGPGIVGRWEQRWFRLEGSVLDSFASSEATSAQHRIPLREISSLSFERDKCECTFVVQGTKVRLRAESEKLAWTWFRSLLELVQLHSIDKEAVLEDPSGAKHKNRPLVAPASARAARRQVATPSYTEKLSMSEPEAEKSARSLSPRSAGWVRSGPWTPRVPPEKPPKATRPRTAAAMEPPARCAQLHSLHEARLQRRETQRRLAADAERKRILDNKEAALKSCGRPGPFSDLNPQEASDRLFNDHKASQERSASLQRKLVEEEREAVNRTRFRKQLSQCGSAPLAPPREAAERMHREHERREQKRREREERAMHAANPVPSSAPNFFSDTVSQTSSTPTSTRHVELHGHAQLKMAVLERRRREKEEAEMERFADFTVHKRRGPVDPGRFEHLYADHEMRNRRLAEKQEMKRRMELAEMQQLQQALSHPARRTSYGSSPRRSLDTGQSSDEDRSRFPGFFSKVEDGERPRTPTPTSRRGRKQERQQDRLAELSLSSWRSSPEPASPEDVLLAAVLSTVQARCGCPSSPSHVKQQLAQPLKAAAAAFREASAFSAQGEGHAALCNRQSMRLFHDCRLLSEPDGFRSCVEPNPIRQVEEDLDSLLVSASKAQAILQSFIAPAHDSSTWAAGTSRASPAAVPWALFAHNPGPKTRAAAETKAFVLYQPSEGEKRYRHLLDLARLSLVFPNSRLLAEGLDAVMSQFQVLDVRNHFRSPSRIGDRCVEVLLAVEVDVGGFPVPHVCELRLEEHAFYTARQDAAPHFQQFLSELRSQYMRPSLRMDALSYLARSVLMTASESHSLRILRRHTARRFGSSVACWRQELGGKRLMHFQFFRDVCHALKLREHTPAYWAELEAGRGGCISLLEFDPEALGLLVRLRSKLLALLGREGLDQEAMFTRLTHCMKLAKAGHLQVGEFRSIGRACSLSVEESDRAFSLLEAKGETGITPADLWWLANMPTLIDIQSALMEVEVEPPWQPVRPPPKMPMEGRSAVGRSSPATGLVGADLPSTPMGRPSPPSSYPRSEPDMRQPTSRPPSRSSTPARSERERQGTPRERERQGTPRRSQPALDLLDKEQEERLVAAARRFSGVPSAPALIARPPTEPLSAPAAAPMGACEAAFVRQWQPPPPRSPVSPTLSDSHLSVSSPRRSRHSMDGYSFRPVLAEVGEGEEPSPEPLAAPSSAPASADSADSPASASRQVAQTEEPNFWPDQRVSIMPIEAVALLSRSGCSMAWAQPWGGWQRSVPEDDCVQEVEEANPQETWTGEAEENPLEVF